MHLMLHNVLACEGVYALSCSVQGLVVSVCVCLSVCSFVCVCVSAYVSSVCLSDACRCLPGRWHKGPV